MNRQEKRNKQKELNILSEIITIIKQYFPELIDKFESLTDTRNQSYIKYQMKVIFIVRLMALMCEIKSMHELTREFNTEEIEKIKIIRYREAEENREFVYITDLPISNKNIETTINTGRRRWKIENEGFNVQKNGTFDIGHLYSKNSTAIKVHYLLIQIAHIIRQLLENGSKSIK